MTDPRPGAWQIEAWRDVGRDRVVLQLTARPTNSPAPVTLEITMSRDEARRIAALIGAAAGDALHRSG